MDHIDEAKKLLSISGTKHLVDEISAVPPSDKAIALATANALISIAESLQTLTMAVRDSAIDVHEVK